MSKFSQQQSIAEEKRLDIKENERSSRETLGKFYYDLSKLAFATTVVNGSGFIISNELTFDMFTSICLGIILIILFAILGYRTIKIK